MQVLVQQELDVDNMEMSDNFILLKLGLNFHLFHGKCTPQMYGDHLRCAKKCDSR